MNPNDPVIIVTGAGAGIGRATATLFAESGARVIAGDISADRLESLRIALRDRQREIVQLAQRALDLGYALCAREPARAEARRMRKDGWWDGCWVANSAIGLVPTSLAIAAALPERADGPMERVA